MRTTIDIPDAVLRRAKAVAALEGKTLRAFVVEAIIHELTSRARPRARRKRVALPLIRSPRPGALRIAADTVADALDAEDMHALG